MKKSRLSIFEFVMPFVALTSCEGYKCGSGKVVDKLTNKPLDSVFCEVITGSETSYTDSTGAFHLCNNMGGCMPCKDIIIRFSKANYRAVEVKNAEGAVVYMQR